MPSRLCTPGGASKPATVLSGLTSPQGLAFAKVSGQWVLYVGESDQIDRYPWAAGGISGARTVIAAHLPDLDSSGDDVHRPKDVVVAPARQSSGVGAAMMRFALACCRQKGCYKLVLSSNAKRTRAHAFYESLDFERHGYSFRINLDQVPG